MVETASYDAEVENAVVVSNQVHLLNDCWFALIFRSNYLNGFNGTMDFSFISSLIITSF